VGRFAAFQPQTLCFLESEDRAIIKIKEYKVAAKGKRGHTIAIPSLWARDHGVKPGCTLEMYQDEEDRLIILPPQK
jgi:hypothetical protein